MRAREECVVLLQELKMLKPKHKIKVSKIKKQFVYTRYKLLQMDCNDNNLFDLIEEGIILCDKVLIGFVSAKHFNDHMKLTSLGLDSYIWLNLMKEKHLIFEE